MSTSTAAPANDDTASYRLPTTVLPNAYRLTLTPDLGAASFTGDVAIDVAIGTPTATVVLNAAELDITTATIELGGGDAEIVATVTLDPTEERAVLTFAEDRLKKFQYELEHPSSNRHLDMLNSLLNAYVGCVDDAADLIQLGSQFIQTLH